MESGDIGSRRAECGSAVAAICDVAVFVTLRYCCDVTVKFLPELYTVPDGTFIRDDAATCELCRDTNGGSRVEYSRYTLSLSCG
jgi:hypothetical protein